MRRDDHGPAPVRVEVLIVGARDGTVFYRRASAELPRDAHPDAVAAGLAATPVDARPVAEPSGQGGAQCDGPQPVWAPPPLTILHSTSWRYADGGVVLTYVAVLDGVPDPDAIALQPHGIAHSGDPTAPSPPRVCLDAVATHAARHLAWLRATDEIAATALTGVPDVWHALERFTPGPAGGIQTPPPGACEPALRQ